MLTRIASREDVAWVVANMRDLDRREVFAGRWTDEPADLVEDIETSRAMLIRLDALCTAAGEPVALLGAWLSSPGVGHALMIATDHWAEIAALAHRYVVKRFLPLVCAPNLRRLECRAWAGHHVSRAWLERLGFVEEGFCHALGKGGEDFVQFAWFPPRGV
jgi:hypothetical protein